VTGTTGAGTTLNRRTKYVIVTADIAAYYEEDAAALTKEGQMLDNPPWFDHAVCIVKGDDGVDYCLDSANGVMWPAKQLGYVDWIRPQPYKPITDQWVTFTPR
jgi:hypothetical protein